MRLVIRCRFQPTHSRMQSQPVGLRPGCLLVPAHPSPLQKANSSAGPLFSASPRASSPLKNSPEFAGNYFVSATLSMKRSERRPSETLFCCRGVSGGPGVSGGSIKGGRSRCVVSDPAPSGWDRHNPIGMKHLKTTPLFSYSWRKNRAINPNKPKGLLSGNPGGGGTAKRSTRCGLSYPLTGNDRENHGAGKLLASKEEIATQPPDAAKS